MSTQVFPTATQLPGVTYNIKRTPQFSNTTPIAISGKETRVALWSMPRYTYELEFEFLRSTATLQQLQLLAAFYLSRLGGYDSFLFNDIDDNAVLAQPIGTGDGATTNFQLVRSFGQVGQPLWTDNILAPNVISTVYLNGTPTGAYTFTGWETAAPGVLAFSSAPGSGVAITADFTFYWPCRFSDDTLDFQKFMQFLWEAKKVKFITIK